MRSVFVVVFVGACAATAVAPDATPRVEPIVVADDPAIGAIAVAADDDGVYWVGDTLDVIALTDGDTAPRVIRPSWGDGVLLGLGVTDGVVVVAGDAPNESWVEVVPLDGDFRRRLVTLPSRTVQVGMDARDGFAIWPTDWAVQRADVDSGDAPVPVPAGVTALTRIDGAWSYLHARDRIWRTDGSYGTNPPLVDDCLDPCRFAVDDGQLFYPVYGVRLVQVDVARGETTTLTNQIGVIDKLVVDDTDVYAMTNTGGPGARTIWRVPRDGSTPTELVDLPRVSDLAVSAAGVYLLDQGRVLLVSRDSL